MGTGKFFVRVWIEPVVSSAKECDGVTEVLQDDGTADNGVYEVWCMRGSDRSVVVDSDCVPHGYGNEGVGGRKDSGKVSAGGNGVRELLGETAGGSGRDGQEDSRCYEATDQAADELPEYPSFSWAEQRWQRWR